MNKGSKTSALQKTHNLNGFIFLLPLIIVFGLIMAYSLYFLARYSFFNLNIAFSKVDFVGFDNYKSVLNDKIFYRSLFNTFLISSGNIFCGLTLAYFIAIILNFKIKCKRLLHAIFFIPSMLPIALMAAVFNSILQYKEGEVNLILNSLGLGVLAQRWLSDPKIAIFSVMSVSIFLIGIPIMYYTAALTTVNTSVLEAATMDGAKMHHMLFLILYPMLKNTHKTIAISMLLGGFREMDRVFLMTDGGPGGATEIVGTYIYRAFQTPNANIGRIAATAVIVLIISFAIGFVQMKLRK